jgi:hypothetical protein
MIFFDIAGEMRLTKSLEQSTSEADGYTAGE